MKLITVLAVIYVNFLDGALVTETIFSWPDLSQDLTVSSMNVDMNSVVGAILLIGFIYVVRNSLADVLY